MTIHRIPVDTIEGIIRPQDNEKPRIIFVLDNGTHRDVEFPGTVERDRAWGTIEHELEKKDLDFVYHRNMCVRPDRLTTVEPGRTLRGEKTLHFRFTCGVEFKQFYADGEMLAKEYAQLAIALAFAQHKRTNCVSFTTH